MAKIRLGRYTSEEEDLPDVCMRCGAPTTLRIRKKFNWYPWWVYLFLLVNLLVFIIVAAILTKRRTVSAPLCAEHRRHWLWRNLIIWLSLLGWLGLLFVAIGVSGNAGRGQDWLVGTIWVGMALGLLAWVVMTIWLQVTTIRPTQITDRSITLTGVSEEFVRAYEEEYLPAPDQLDRAVRERWGREDRVAGREDRFEALDEPEERGKPPDTYRKG